MKKIRVEYVEREPTEKEKAGAIKHSRELTRLLDIKLDPYLYDGKEWFQIHIRELISLPLDKVVLKDVKQAVEKNCWRVLYKILVEGRVELSDRTVEICGIAAEPICRELED